MVLVPTWICTWGARVERYRTRNNVPAPAEVVAAKISWPTAIVVRIEVEPRVVGRRGRVGRRTEGVLDVVGVVTLRLQAEAPTMAAPAVTFRRRLCRVERLPAPGAAAGLEAVREDRVGPRDGQGRGADAAFWRYSSCRPRRGRDSDGVRAGVERPVATVALRASEGRAGTGGDVRGADRHLPPITPLARGRQRSVAPFTVRATLAVPAGMEFGEG